MAANATKEYRLLIGGAWEPGSAGSYDIINPATESVVGRAPQASAADAEAAAQAARDALAGWKRTSPETRANLLTALADEIRKRNDDLLPLIMAETGATLKVGSALQVPQAVARFERYARGAMQDLSIPLPPSVMPSTPLAAGGVIGGLGLRQPVGVVACISPYNFPLVNMAGKVGPALATGNTIVMKPAPQDPLAIIEFADICQQVGFPPGVVNVVTGSAPELGAALVGSKNVDMISFTGSTAVGTRIFEAGGQTDEAPPPGARRQGRLHRVRGRRPGQGRHRAGQRLGVPLRPDLHRPHPGHRAPQRLRQARRRPARPPPRTSSSVRPRRPTPSSAPSSRASTETGSSSTSRPAARRAGRCSSTGDDPPTCPRATTSARPSSATAPTT